MSRLLIAWHAAGNEWIIGDEDNWQQTVARFPTLAEAEAWVISEHERREALA